ESVTFDFNLPSDSDFDKVIVYRDGSKVTEISSGTFKDNGLKELKTYSYKFVTVDKTGNISAGISKAITTLNKPVIT
ncbi:fibronectin type III domain-containing protein, partial [Planococcus sp. SIMBA_143]